MSPQQKTAKSWRDNLPEMLKSLENILNLPVILSKLSNINQLILIPHRDLHRFPIHALFPNTFTITYLPSAQLGLNPQTRLFVGRCLRATPRYANIKAPGARPG